MERFRFVKSMPEKEIGRKILKGRKMECRMR